MKRTQLKRTPLLAAGPSFHYSTFHKCPCFSAVPRAKYQMWDETHKGVSHLETWMTKNVLHDLKARMIFHLPPCGVWVVPDFNVAYFHGFLDDHMGPDFNCHRFLGGFNHYRVHLALLKLRPSGVEAKSRQCVDRLVCLTKSGFTPPHT